MRTQRIRLLISKIGRLWEIFTAFKSLLKWLYTPGGNFPVQDFIARTQAIDFDGAKALDMLHRLNTIDYGSQQAGSSAADNTEKYHPLFNLDFLSIVGSR